MGHLFSVEIAFTRRRHPALRFVPEQGSPPLFAFGPLACSPSTERLLWPGRHVSVWEQSVSTFNLWARCLGAAVSPPPPPLAGHCEKAGAREASDSWRPNDQQFQRTQVSRAPGECQLQDQQKNV